MDDKFTIKIGGEPKTIKMTFGLQNTLARVVGDIEGVPEMAFNPELRDAVLQEILSERNEEGIIENRINLFYLDVDGDEVVKLMDWAGAHVLDFLLKSMESTKALMEGNKSRLMALRPSSSGGED